MENTAWVKSVYVARVPVLRFITSGTWRQLSGTLGLVIVSSVKSKCFIQCSLILTERSTLYAIRQSTPLFQPSQIRSHNQPQSATRRPNRTNLTYLAYRTLVLGVVLRTIERTGETGLASIDGCVRGTANVEFAESVELDVDGVVRRALAHSFDFSCLGRS